MTRVVIVVGLVLALATGSARAYPQFQLSKDQTCSGCHISPAGGGLLTENGMATAEAMGQWGAPPEFFYNAIKTPSWLSLGGDMRGAYGYLQTPQRYLVGFPMQVDLYANAGYKGFRLQVTLGYRPGIYTTSTTSSNFEPPWSREHYLMWQQNEGSPEGLFVRAGRFMPVFGLRLAEHADYTRRYGGTQLYGETYGAAVEYVSHRYEGHLTGFIKDPLIDTVEHSNGAAGYAEVRPTEQLAVGAEGMVTVSPDDKKYRGGVTGKLYIPELDVLFQGELQFVNQHIRAGNFGLNELVGYVMGSWFATRAVMVDAGFGHYDDNLRIRSLYRDAFDLNAHWFVNSHFEALLTARIELFAFGSGGPTGSYVLFQGHYRL